ncbi:hypothetical protein WDU94_002663, partial [Cyamophila willieti]
LGYTGHLSINGIPGHHYHTIGNNIQPRSPPEENNNNTNETTNQNAATSTTSQFYNQEPAIVSSSSQDNLNDVKNELSMDDYPIHYSGGDIEDFPYPIIADTTVSNDINDSTSRESWMDLDELIEGASNQIKPNALQAYVEDFSQDLNPQDSPNSLPNITISFPHHNNNNTTTNNNNKVQSTSSMYPCNTMSMSLLQERLKNGPPKNEYSSTSPSSSTSTLYLAHSPQQVPHVVSTSDLVMRYQPVHSSTTRPSPELQVSFPHTTTPSKKNRNKNNRGMKQANSQQQPSSSTILYDSNNLGKEKPVHRCTICNRGFLNKSNIKVHLRTHTGEKPFRCDVCGKAFRQKAHLIKHAQIHKRIGRD